MNYGKEAAVRKIGIDIKKFSKEYMDVSSSKFKNEINFEMKVLEEYQFVQLLWEKHSLNQYLDKVYLNENYIESIYQLLNRTSKAGKCKKFELILKDFLQYCEDDLKPFIQDNLEKLANFETPHKIINLDNELLTNNCLKGLNELIKPKIKELSKRHWSIQVYNNSKRWEEIEKKVLSVLINDIYPEYKNIEDESIIRYFDILENPVPIDMYGQCVMVKSDKKIDFSTDDSGIAAYPSFFKDAAIELLNVKRLITIENKTSYHDYLRNAKDIEEELVIYLGGFHNTTRTYLLKNLFAFSNANHLNIQFYHWGDIDLGGFSILVNLIKKTGIPFTPLFMDEQTYLKYLQFGKPIKEKTYLNKLHGLLKQNEFSKFEDVINLILENEIIIEQEIIEIYNE
ncbi:Wadjet anti-phage system protein JetD domain-containing protein [Lysinibacillus sp. FSL W7-1291]|uniref:Wadjet anti-phage system protein JetD domain-containing protein n=1 Tax=Lysinibacillus sp. FSL W7-1291 TaxID=2954544 RepID=UPI00315A6C05